VSTLSPVTVLLALDPVPDAPEDVPLGLEESEELEVESDVESVLDSDPLIPSPLEPITALSAELGPDVEVW